MASGLSIDHEYDEFEDGCILTLQDQPVIDSNQGILNEDDDKLENINLQEINKAKHRIKQRIKGNNPQESDEEDEGYQDGAKILPKYSEPNKRKRGLVLDSHGKYNPEQKHKTAKNEQTCDSTKKFIPSDYERMEDEKRGKFKKRKKDKGNLKRQPITETEDIEKYLAFRANTDSTDMKDISSRKRKKLKELEDLEQEQKEKESRLESFHKALEKAKANQFAGQEEDEEDEYNEIEREIEKQRESAFKIPNMNMIGVRGNNQENENKLIEIITDIQEMEEEEKGETIQNVQQTMPRYISDNTLFNNRVETQKESLLAREKKTEEHSIIDTQDGRVSVVNISLPSERIRRTMISGISQEEKMENEENKSPKEESKESRKDKELETNKMHEEMETLAEPLVRKGIGVALKVFRSRGMLGHSIERGRNKDKTATSELAKFNPASSDNIQIEHKDAKGRRLAPKEAYRELCGRFHGARPSKRRLLKQLKKEELRSKTATQDQIKDSKLMKTLNYVQNKQKTPYLILDSKTTAIF